MSNEKLSHAVSILYDMELNIYGTQRAINKIEQEISWLGKERKIEKPSKEGKDCSIIGSVCMFVLIGGGIAALLGAIAQFFFLSSTFWLFRIFEAFFNAIAWAFNSIPVGILFGLIHYIIKRIKETKRVNEWYEESCKKYELAVVDNARRLKNEKAQKSILVHQKATLEQRLQKSRNLLQDFYNRAHIDREYRNVIAIGYMNRFLQLGVSSQLEGVNGLYYLVKQEIRMDNLQESLDNISYKLDTLIDQQHKLYSAVQNVSYKCDCMVNAAVESAKQAARANVLLEQAVSNTEIAAYNSQRIAMELRYQNFMLTY